MALRNLTFNHKGRRAAIVAAGGLEALVALVREGAPGASENAAMALRRYET